MSIVSLSLAYVSLIVGLAIGYLYAKLKAGNIISEVKLQSAKEVSDIKELYAKAVADTENFKRQIVEEREKSKRQQEEYTKMSEQLKAEFTVLANELLKRNTTDFNAATTEKLTNLLTPFKTDLDNLKKEMAEANKTTSNERISLREQVKSLMDMSNKLSSETNSLTHALKGENKMQGNLGEMQLVTLLEDSGLEEGIGYDCQKSIKDDLGKDIKSDDNRSMIPDVVVHFPEDRHMIIDSKMSMVSYVNYYNHKGDEVQQANDIKGHLQSIRAHIDELSKKDYSKFYKGSLEAVMMYVPLEGAYQLAISNDENLWKYAYDKKVLLMSPTNLITALKLVETSWRQHSREKNILEILNRGQLMYEKIASYCESFIKVGDKIKDAGAAYDKAMLQLKDGSGNLIGQAEKMRKLGLSVSKRIPEGFLTSENQDNE